MSHDHAHGHDHGHAHAHGPDDAHAERRLVGTLVLTGLWMGVEALGGWWTGSLALLADAGHMLSDSASLLIALGALRIARRPPDARRTFGWHRAEVLAAVANGASLVGIGAAIAVEAVDRWRSPAEVDGPAMFGIAFGGLVVNALAMLILAGGRSGGLNLRAAWLHVMSDALGSVGAMVAGACVWFAGWRVADPIASVLIALLVVRGAWNLLKDAVDVLMEAAPLHLDVPAIRAALLAEPGVLGVHDLHVWCLTPGRVALSGHVVSAGGDGELLARLVKLLHQRFAIAHSTLQIEAPGFDEPELHP